jgi:hypothetical protein
MDDAGFRRERLQTAVTRLWERLKELKEQEEDPAAPGRLSANDVAEEPTWSRECGASSRPVKTKAPRKPERSQNLSEPQAATLVGLTSRRLLELAIGIARGFIASGISRTRSTCRSPFSRLAPLT